MKNIKFGMPQLIELEHLEDNFKLCAELGLKFLELNFNLPNMQPDLINKEEIMSLKEKYEIQLTAHLHEEMDLGHFNSHINAAYLNIIKDSIELGRAVGIDKLNLHMNKGIHFTLPTEKREVYSQHQPEYLNQIQRSVKRLDEMLKDSEIELVIENTGLFNRDHICKAVDLLIESPYISLTYDVGHNKIHNGADDAYLSYRSSEIKHFHLHDATLKQDHLPLFTGELDFSPYFKQALQNNATCLIEVKTKAALKQSIVALNEYLEHSMI